MPIHQLSATELDVVWRAEFDGAPPSVLCIPSPGRTDTERQAIERAAWNALRERGFVGPDGLRSGPRRLLGVLERPSVRLELRGRWGERVLAIAAAGPDGQAITLRRNDTVLISDCSGLPAALISVLPPGHAGPGRPCALPSRALATALAAPDRIAALADEFITPGQARELDWILGGLARWAQIVALAAHPGEPLRRTRGMLTVAEGSAGRYLLATAPAPDGTDWTTVAPCGTRRLRQRVAGLLPGTSVSTSGR